MTALVYRLAQGLGLHRDGEKPGLGPFETEVRRRLWWYIYLLDSQTSEHQARSPQIYEGTYDTEFPLNVNDDDLSPEATVPFQEREGFTEMTFCLIRCEINVRYRRILKGIMPGLGPTRLSVEDTAHALTETSTFIENKRLKYCDLSVAIQWVAATITRIALARSWLVAHLSLIGSDDLSSDLWQQDWPPRVWVLWKPLSRLMERVTARRANDISTGNPQQLPVSFLPDFTHIPSTWASQQPETSTTGASDPGSDTLVMEMYRDIVRDMTID
jgi:hypothetical protein